MEYCTFGKNPLNKYKVALIIKTAAFSPLNLRKHYIEYLSKQGIAKEDIIAIGLDYNDKNKCPVALAQQQLDKAMPTLIDMGVTHLLVADPVYFKRLTKLTKTEPFHGYIKECKYPAAEHMKVLIGTNYQALFHNPTVEAKLQMSMDALVADLGGTFQELGTGIIHSAVYPRTLKELEDFLTHLLQYPALTADIETKSLELESAGIATMGFAWDQHNGGAFPIDRAVEGLYKHDDKFNAVRDRMELLREFLEQYKGQLIYHNATFDIKMLIFSLWMHRDPLNRAGLIRGLKTMFRNIDDTKIITYLATNSTSGNTLGLKQNAFEFAGNYAQEEINDTTKIPLKDLLEYNLVDCLSTWYVYNKYHQKMIDDDQLQIHDEIFIPSSKVITHMELVGMPQNYTTVMSQATKLEHILDYYNHMFQNQPLVKAFIMKRAKEEMLEKNLLLKRKVKPLEDFIYPVNPNSAPQLQELIYDYLKYPVTDLTDGGAPATGNKTLKNYLKILKDKFDIKDEELKPWVDKDA